MGSFFSSIWKKLTGKKNGVRLLMVGLDNAGKTTILYQLKIGETTKTVPTIGFNLETIQFKGLNFTIWDVNGQEHLRVLWKHYYKETDGIIFVVDSSDRERIEEANKELSEMLSEEELKGISILIMANKQDIEGSMSPTEVTEKLGLLQVKNKEWNVQGTSAITGQGLQDGLDWLAGVLLKN